MSISLTIEQILSASTFSELFKDTSKKEYRRVLKAAHPDLHPGNEIEARKAFIHVNKLWKMRTEPTDIRRDIFSSETIFTKKHSYVNVKLWRKANGVNHYRGTLEDTNQKVSLSIASHPKLSPLLFDGIKAVKDAKSQMPENYTEFYPEVVDAFYLKQDSHKLAGVAQLINPTFYSLKEVNEDYPEGIDGRDSAWIFRRMLVALGNLHDYGYAHSGVNLESFLIEPETHRLFLQDYQYITELGSSVRIVNYFSKPFYSASKTATIQTDLKMAAKLISELTDYRTISKRIARFYKAAISYPAPTAAEMLGDYDYILHETYGERTFHEFRMKRKI